MKIKWFEMTWIGWLNRLVLQWFFIRLAGAYDSETEKRMYFLILRWIKPTTGWNDEFYFVKRKPPLCFWDVVPK